MDDKIVGAMMFSFQGKKIHMYGICVPEKGHQIGEQLIHTLIELGKSFGKHEVTLSCNGEKLMNYYKQQGFIVIAPSSYKMKLKLSKQ